MLLTTYARFIKAARLGGALAYAARHAIGGQSAPIYLDVGARGGLARPWRLAAYFDIVRPIFVEPDPVEAERLANTGASVIPCALGACNESRDLHLTKERGRSSLLRPAERVLSGFSSGEPWVVEQTVTVEVKRLDEIWDRYARTPPHYVKIDTQGFEQEILSGMGAILDDVMCLQFETTFVPFYEGQPCFQDLFNVLHGRSFDLVKVRPAGLFNSAILEFDAFMVQRRCHNEPIVKFWKIINDVGSHRRIVVRGF